MVLLNSVQKKNKTKINRMYIYMNTTPVRKLIWIYFVTHPIVMFPEFTPCFWWGHCSLSFYIYILCLSLFLTYCQRCLCLLSASTVLRSGIRVAHLFIILCRVSLCVWLVTNVGCVSWVRPTLVLRSGVCLSSCIVVSNTSWHGGCPIRARNWLLFMSTCIHNLFWLGPCSSSFCFWWGPCSSSF